MSTFLRRPCLQRTPCQVFLGGSNLERYTLGTRRSTPRCSPEGGCQVSPQSPRSGGQVEGEGELSTGIRALLGSPRGTAPRLLGTQGFQWTGWVGSPAHVPLLHHRAKQALLFSWPLGLELTQRARQRMSILFFMYVVNNIKHIIHVRQSNLLSFLQESIRQAKIWILGNLLSLRKVSIQRPGAISKLLTWSCPRCRIFWV